MTREEIRAKLEAGEQLTPMESALLEAYLEEDRSGEAASAVAGLVDHPPSLAWRSGLNQALAEARPKEQIWSRLSLKLAAGGLATALACLVIFAAVKSSAPEWSQRGELSEVLVQWHEEAAANRSMNGAAESDNTLFSESVRSL